MRTILWAFVSTLLLAAMAVYGLEISSRHLSDGPRGGTNPSGYAR